jgi:hypothetical protein
MASFCRECKEPVSWGASHCLRCGEENPTGAKHGDVWLVGLVISVLVFIAFVIARNPRLWASLLK